MSFVNNGQCYKRITGLYLQVYKNRHNFINNYCPTCSQIQYTDARFHLKIASALAEINANFKLNKLSQKNVWF